MAAKRSESVRGHSRRRFIILTLSLNYCMCERGSRGAGAGVRRRSRCASARRAAPRPGRAAPARAPRRRSRCSTSARTASTAPSACAAPPPAPRPPASRASRAPAGTRSPRGSATHAHTLLPAPWHTGCGRRALTACRYSHTVYG